MSKRSKKSQTGSLTGDRILATNRKAKFNYELGDTYEAGISLIGSEARSLRETSPGINEAFVDFDSRSQAWVKQMRISTMKHAAFSHSELRPRKLLLHRVELNRLRAAVERDGMTVVPTKVYYKDGRAKLEISLARGKKNYDKRQTLKERTADREARAAIARGRKDY